MTLLAGNLTSSRITRDFLLNAHAQSSSDQTTFLDTAFFGDVEPGSYATIIISGSNGGTNAATTSHVFPRFATVVNKDVLVCHFAMNGGSITGFPTGWILLSADSSITNPHSFVYMKVITNAGSEPSSYTWTSSGSVDSAGSIITFRHVDNVNPWDVDIKTASSAVASTSAITPSLTTLRDNVMLVGGASGNSSTTTWTPPGTMTEYYDSGAGKAMTISSNETFTPHGATGTRTWTQSASREWNAWLLALRPEFVLGTGLTASFTGVGESSFTLTGRARATGSLTGTAQSAETITGRAQARGALSGTGQSAATFTGRARSLGILTGSDQSAFTVQGSSHAYGSLSGSGQSVFTLLGNARSRGSLSGSGQSLFTLLGNARSHGSLAGSGQSTGSILSQMRANGALSGIFTSDGSITSQLRMFGSWLGSAQSSMSLLGNANAYGQFNGIVESLLTLLGAAEAQSSLSGVFTSDGSITGRLLLLSSWSGSAQSSFSLLGEANAYATLPMSADFGFTFAGIIHVPTIPTTFILPQVHTTRLLSASVANGKQDQQIPDSNRSIVSVPLAVPQIIIRRTAVG